MIIQAFPKPTDSATALPIAIVERDTGLSKDTLRVWERRYGFPQPLRDTRDERLYPPEQVERLRLVARLLNHGHRPGRVVPMTTEALQALVLASGSEAAAPAVTPEQQALLDLLRQHDAPALRRSLNQSVLRLGLARFLTDLLAPMNEAVGEAWARSEIQVFEEHLYTETVIAVLRGALGAQPALTQPGRPRVLLTTLPQEAHALGLLMAEVILTLEGCPCISLGTRTPMPDIVRAASAHEAQVVGLSVSLAYPAQHLLRDLQALRRQLPPPIRLWVGGNHPALRRRPLAGIVHVETLQDLETLLQATS